MCKKEYGAMLRFCATRLKKGVKIIIGLVLFTVTWTQFFISFFYLSLNIKVSYFYTFLCVSFESSSLQSKSGESLYILQIFNSTSVTSWNLNCRLFEIEKLKPIKYFNLNKIWKFRAGALCVFSNFEFAPLQKRVNLKVVATPFFLQKSSGHH